MSFHDSGAVQYFSHLVFLLFMQSFIHSFIDLSAHSYFRVAGDVKRYGIWQDDT